MELAPTLRADTAPCARLVCSCCPFAGTRCRSTLPP